MDLFTRYLTILTFFIFINIGGGIAQQIELQTDSIDRYVMNPATFHEDANSNSIWKLAPPFGRKDPTIHRSGTKNKVNQLLKPARINPFQV